MASLHIHKILISQNHYNLDLAKLTPSYTKSKLNLHSKSIALIELAYEHAKSSSSQHTNFAYHQNSHFAFFSQTQSRYVHTHHNIATLHITKILIFAKPLQLGPSQLTPSRTKSKLNLHSKSITLIGLTHNNDQVDFDLTTKFVYQRNSHFAIFGQTRLC